MSLHVLPPFTSKALAHVADYICTAAAAYLTSSPCALLSSRCHREVVTRGSLSRVLLFYDVVYHRHMGTLYEDLMSRLGSTVSLVLARVPPSLLAPPVARTSPDEGIEPPQRCGSEEERSADSASCCGGGGGKGVNSTTVAADRIIGEPDDSQLR